MNLLAWWNLLFELPIVAACLLSTMAALGSDGHHDGEHDADHDTEAEHDHEAEVDHDHEHDHNADTHAHDAAHESGWFEALFALCGADRAPLSIVLVVLFLAFGFIGLVCNHLLSSLMPPLAFVWLSLAAAAAGGLAISRTFARAFSKVLPRTETYALGREACVGRQGTITAAISAKDGYAQIYDPNRNLLEVRVRASGDSSFQLGTKILLLRYDEKNSCFEAEPFDPDAPGASVSEGAPVSRDESARREVDRRERVR